MPDGVGGDWKSGGFVKAHLVGNYMGVLRWCGNLLGMASVQVYSYTLATGTRLVETDHAIVASSAGDPVV